MDIGYGYLSDLISVLKIEDRSIDFWIHLHPTNEDKTYKTKILFIFKKYLDYLFPELGLVKNDELDSPWIGLLS